MKFLVLLLMTCFASAYAYGQDARTLVAQHVLCGAHRVIADVTFKTKTGQVVTQKTITSDYDAVWEAANGIDCVAVATAFAALTTVPLSRIWPAASSICNAPQPTTQGFPQPRATTAA